MMVLFDINKATFCTLGGLETRFLSRQAQIIIISELDDSRHVPETHGKCDAIEDDVWGKLIVMESTQGVRSQPCVGGREGFDGLRVGLQGFDITSNNI